MPGLELVARAFSVCRSPKPITLGKAWESNKRSTECSKAKSVEQSTTVSGRDHREVFPGRQRAAKGWRSKCAAQSLLGFLR